jgi:acetoacetyl-CoA synthetase
LQRRDDRPAVVAVREDGSRHSLTHNQLAAQVAGMQRALRQAGIVPGDRIGAVMPNTWQTLVAMLAASSLRAVWSSCSPEFGTHGIIDRFGQIAPKLLIACAGYAYAGKTVDQVDKINQVVAQLPQLEHLLVVPYTRVQTRSEEFSGPQVTLWDDFFQPGGRPSSPCPSITRCTSSIPAAPPVCPSASSTGPAAYCCNTSRNTACTMT